MEEILKELARTKIEKADYMDALERKWLEIRQLTQKCSQLEQELHQAKVDLQDKQVNDKLFEFFSFLSYTKDCN